MKYETCGSAVEVASGSNESRRSCSPRSASFASRRWWDSIRSDGSSDPILSKYHPHEDVSGPIRATQSSQHRLANAAQQRINRAPMKPGF
ncbi:unnamed protein product [Protopolystoma xenopodis]|uniref:Uncharacterized protein n=1 Tax=Protopolystoma xenopodis TaxID=117903 RepID=A0A448X5A9_9PLAT|nr:unnamed protein product [Protopolystoma xenopodis]